MSLFYRMILSKKPATFWDHALAARLPDLIFCPAGGIDAQKAKDYLVLANVACAGGSLMAESALLAAQDFGKVEPLAREASALERRN
jgi:2-dehydro-3-deoxyphosphogluconate aldolase / (4S)-4-hydroxy-2-oxoglutarate aldolase